MEEDNRAGTLTDPDAVRSALREELTSRGHVVASDTLGLRPDLYIIGDNDLARALFHFDDDAGRAVESIYRSSGSWVAGMPPRFVVLPSAESDSPSLELLEQMRAVPLLHHADAGRVTFHDLDELLAEHLQA